MKIQGKWTEWKSDRMWSINGGEMWKVNEYNTYNYIIKKRNNENNQKKAEIKVEVSVIQRRCELKTGLRYVEMGSQLKRK